MAMDAHKRWIHLNFAALALAATLSAGCGGGAAAAGTPSGGADTGSAGSGDTGGADSSGADLGAASDSAANDAAASGDGSDATADTASDAAGKSTPWGPVSGQCGVLAAELASKAPAFVVNTWHFAKPGPFDPAPLRSGAKKRYDGPNAGGSSKCSEVMSMQLLYECEGAVTLKPEVEISYDAPGAITDWLASFGGVKIGVSVTRAYKGPSATSYTQADADTLLTKKLKGILEASKNVSAADKWQKSLLHVWTLRPDWVPVLEASWKGLDPAIKADTIVVVTVEDGASSVVTDTCQ